MKHQYNHLVNHMFPDASWGLHVSIGVFNLTTGSPMHAAACSLCLSVRTSICLSVCLPACPSVCLSVCLLPDAIRRTAGKTKAGKATASKAPAKARKAASPRKKPAKAALAPEQVASDVEVSLSDAEEQQPQASSSLQAGDTLISPLLPYPGMRLLSAMLIAVCLHLQTFMTTSNNAQDAVSALDGLVLNAQHSVVWKG